MGVPGALQCRVFAPKGGVQSWSLPVWVIGMISPSVGQGLGSLDPGVFLNRRIADAMNISDGDNVEFELLDAAERFETPVRIKDDISADVIVHGAIFMGLATSETTCGGSTSTLVLKSGKEVESVVQEIWAGMKVVSMEGMAVLYFDGASRNNLNGPAGYGYSLVTGREEEEDLVRGYGFYESGSNNEMEYKGLLEGLTWALRLDLKVLSIRGDSELVIKQCNDEYQVQCPKLRVYYQKIKALLKRATEEGTKVSIKHISRDKNVRADELANLGVDSRSHATVCNWNNINKMCSRHNHW